MRKHYTCSKCQKIGEWRDMLDDKPVCYSCMHEIEYGEAKRFCRRRGFHEGGSYVTSSLSERGGRAHYFLRLRCNCNQEANVTVEAVREGIFLRVPDGPFYFAIDERGVPRLLDAKECASISAELSGPLH